MYVMVKHLGKNEKTGKNIYQKAEEGVKLFPNNDGSFGNKKEGLTFSLDKFPKLEKGGQKLGYVKELTRADGETFYGVSVGKWGEPGYESFVISKERTKAERAGGQGNVRK